MSNEGSFVRFLPDGHADSSSQKYQRKCDLNLQKTFNDINTGSSTHG